MKRTVETVSMTRVVNRFTRVTMRSSKELGKEKGLFGITLCDKNKGILEEEIRRNPRE